MKNILTVDCEDWYHTRISPKVHSLSKIYGRFLVLLSLAILSSLASPSAASHDTEDAAEKAVMEYRELFSKGKEHHPGLLRVALLRQVGHFDSEVRKNAAEVIGELDRPPVQLLWSMVIKENGSVRYAAVEGLCHSRVRAGVFYLTRLLKDKDIYVREKAAECIADFEDRSVLKSLKTAFASESDPKAKITMAAAMIQLGDYEETEFLKGFLISEGSAELRGYAAQWILFREIPIDSDVLTDLFLNEDVVSVKIWIAGILAKRKNERGFSFLKRLLAGAADGLKSQIARVLTEIGEYEYVYPYLVRLLTTADDFAIREQAVEALIDFVDYPVLSLLGETLQRDEDEIVREVAAWAMGERRDLAALPYLEKGLYDESAFVRTGAMAAIYKILSAN